jgi:acyl carrier protein phosphodiesterase
MNYLGHAYLSFGDAAILCGNMMGDHVKGLHALNAFPEGIKKGLILHRHIDSFTDSHPAMLEAKGFFRPVYGLYSGAVMDTLLDHFLANDSTIFANANALEDFAQQVYRQLGGYLEYFPPKFLPYYQSMAQHNWLGNYRSEEGIQRALNGLFRRAKNITEIESAFIIFKENKNELHTYYTAFIKELINFVKIESGLN